MLLLNDRDDFEQLKSESIMDREKNYHRYNIEMERTKRKRVDDDLNIQIRFFTISQHNHYKKFNHNIYVIIFVVNNVM